MFSNIPHINPGVYSGQLNSHGISFEYKQILIKALRLKYTIPSISQRKKQDNVYRRLVDNGIMRLLDIFYLFATDGDSDFATLQWKNPDLYQASKVNNISFVKNRGFLGDNVSTHLLTNYNASTNGVNYTLNSASRGAYIYTNTNGLIDGLAAANNGNRFSNALTNVFRINQGTNNASASVNLRGIGYAAINRSDSTNLQGYKNQIRSSVTATSTSVVSATQSILRSNTNYSDNGISMYYMGASLTERQHNMVSLIIEDYIKTL